MKGRKTSVYIKEDLQKALHIEPYGWRGASGAVKMVADRYTTLIKAGEKKEEDRGSEGALTYLV